jgi:hypothetical protein
MSTVHFLFIPDGDCLPTDFMPIFGRIPLEVAVLRSIIRQIVTSIITVECRMQANQPEVFIYDSDASVNDDDSVVK